MPARRWNRSWIFGLVAISGVMSCGGDPTDPSGGDPNTITLTSGFTFSPASLTMDAGTTVTWITNTSTSHTVTPGNPQQPGVWARATTSGIGTVLTHTFTVPGQDYSYFCEIHAGMSGVIHVR